MTILITGATGFVGSRLTKSLSGLGYPVLAVTRYMNKPQQSDIRQVLMSDMNPSSEWGPMLCNIDVVIHLAARVHLMRETSIDPLAAFQRFNTDTTLNLAEQAASCKVRRFIFLSSIKVNGECTFENPFSADECNIPTDPYALSKYNAEIGLIKIAKQAGMEVVIIRPPLVYGPGVKGNFLSMISWLHKGIPLPLGAIHNQRSLVALDNLIDLIITCIGHPAAANQIFLVSDNEDLSTSELLHRIGKLIGKPARLLPVPKCLLETSLKVVGKSDISQRLCGNLQVDITKTMKTLDWKPSISVNEGLIKTISSLL